MNDCRLGIKEIIFPVDKIKQVIVVRTDLNMRKGKIASQVAHSAMIFILRSLKEHVFDKNNLIGSFSDIELEWMKGSFTKIVAGVDSEQELLDLYDKAVASGLKAFKMIDNGDTEFSGTPTLTCISLGPDLSSKLYPITGHLKLI